jgi:hypothetical protein
MQTFHFQYSEPAKTNRLMILTAIFYMAVLCLFLLVGVVSIIPVWLILVIFLLAFIGNLAYYKANVITVNCETTKTAGGLLIELGATNFLYKQKEIILNTDLIQNITEYHDSANNNRRCFIITRAFQSAKIMLTQPKTMSEDELHEFSRSVTILARRNV